MPARNCTTEPNKDGKTISIHGVEFVTGDTEFIDRLDAALEAIWGTEE